MEAKSDDTGITELIAALHAHTDAMQALTQSNALLAAAVAQLLGEEMGQPVRDEQKAEPLPDNLDAD